MERNRAKCKENGAEKEKHTHLLEEKQTMTVSVAVKYSGDCPLKFMQ